MQYKHTHPFNGPFSRTTRVSRYHKGKTNLDFTEARDSEWQWHQLGICKCAPRSRRIAMPVPHQSKFFTGWKRPSCRPTNSVKEVKASYAIQKKYKNQPGMNLTPSQSCHVVRWHCTTESKWRVGEINYYYYYYHNKQLTSITSTLPHYQFRAGTDGHSRASFTPDVSTRPMGRPRCPGGAWGVPRTRTWRSIYEW